MWNNYFDKPVLSISPSVLLTCSHLEELKVAIECIELISAMDDPTEDNMRNIISWNNKAIKILQDINNGLVA